MYLFKFGFTGPMVLAVSLLAGTWLTASLAAEARISPERAAALALNRLAPHERGLRLDHRRHTVDFGPQDVAFTPRLSAFTWRWRLTHLGTAERALVPIKPTNPEQAAPDQVSYRRGVVEEQYLAKAASIEQRFVLEAPLALAGQDLVIEGVVDSPGELEITERGWRWRDEQVAVELGQVKVFDAEGRIVPARMAVTAASTRIVVDGAALTEAVYPVTVDPEIGANDFRISDMGPNGSTAFRAFDPAVAYNPTNNEYLVVWEGSDNVGGLVSGELEIFGQRINATTGAEIGANDFRISDMGPTGDPNFDAENPAVAYNPIANEYLVVWSGDNVVDGVFGQRLSATGAPVGVNDFQISDRGVDPAVAYNPINHQYLVVWTGTPVVGDFEIFGQLLSASGGAVGGAFQISFMETVQPPPAMANAVSPAVTHNSTDNEYLVVWSGDDDAGGALADNEFEIYGQRLSAGGAERGARGFRISDMGPDRDTRFNALEPAVAYNPAANEYLVVWQGNAFLTEFEIYGQRLSAGGGQMGINDFQISDMGPTGDARFRASRPDVIYNAAANEYLVAWSGDDNTGGLVDEEFEIFGQRIDGATGAQMGVNDFRISDLGPNGDTRFGAADNPSGAMRLLTSPAVAYDLANNQYLVTWAGDDNTGGLVDNELEIFGQLLSATDEPLLAPRAVPNLGGGVADDLTLRRGNRFFIDSANNGAAAERVFSYGRSPDTVLVGDMDGDGSDDLILRQGNRYLIDTGNDGGAAELSFTFGTSNDLVLLADIDGDGTDNLVIRRGNRFFIDRLNDGGSAELVLIYGTSTDTILMGDLDGNGSDDLIVRRGNRYFIDRANNGGGAEVVFNYGTANDLVFLADIDGDGFDNLVIRRGNRYFFDTANNGGGAEVVFNYGTASDTVLMDDVDRNGTDDLIIRRGNRYFVDTANNGVNSERVLTYGQADDAVFLADLDGDGAGNLVVRRGNRFWVDQANDGAFPEVILRFGDAPDEILVFNADGDAQDELIIRRGNRYFIDLAGNGSTAERAFSYGTANDIVFAVDIDGNGTQDLVIRRGNRYLVDIGNNGGSAERVFTFGRATDAIFVADINGDGTDDLAIRRGNRYFFDTGNNGGGAEWIFAFGTANDVLFLADIDGNDSDDLVIRRGNRFLIDRLNDGGSPELSFSYGTAADTILVGDMNGDGSDDLTVRRGNQFLIDTGNNGSAPERVFNYGLSDDMLVLQ